MYEYAIWLDFYLIDGIDDSAAKTILVEQENANQCLNEIIGGTVGAEEVKLLFAQFHNTYPRSYSYIGNLKHIVGWARADPSNSCR